MGRSRLSGPCSSSDDPPTPAQIASVQSCAAAVSAQFKSTAYEGIAKPLR